FPVPLRIARGSVTGCVRPACSSIKLTQRCSPYFLTKPNGEDFVMKNHPRSLTRVASAILFVLMAAFVGALVSTRQSPEPLTGNWVVRTPSTNNDGTFRTTYLNLKQDDQKITGTLRLTHFFYHISESTDTPDGFTIT